MTGPDNHGVQMPGTKKPATKAGSSGFQVHTGTSEIMYMVPEAGVEPARGYPRGILSPLRLPISPFGR